MSPTWGVICFCSFSGFSWNEGSLEATANTFFCASVTPATSLIATAHYLNLISNLNTFVSCGYSMHLSLSVCFRLSRFLCPLHLSLTWNKIIHSLSKQFFFPSQLLFFTLLANRRHPKRAHTRSQANLCSQTAACNYPPQEGISNMRLSSLCYLSDLSN